MRDFSCMFIACLQPEIGTKCSLLPTCYVQSVGVGKSITVTSLTELSKHNSAGEQEIAK